MDSVGGGGVTYASWERVCISTWMSCMFGCGGGDKFSSGSSLRVDCQSGGVTGSRGQSPPGQVSGGKDQESYCSMACCSFCRCRLYFSSTARTRSASSFSRIIRKFCSSGTENACHCQRGSEETDGYITARGLPCCSFRSCGVYPIMSIKMGYPLSSRRKIPFQIERENM